MIKRLIFNLLLMAGFFYPALALSDVVAFRASILDFIADPRSNPDHSYRFFADGLMIVKDGLIEHVGNYTALKDTLVAKQARLIDYSGKLIMPGFFDTHVHFPQTEMIGAYGEQLLEWLQTYVYPTEKKYSDAAYAEERAAFFLHELLRNGTTTALVFTTVYPQSVDAFFGEAEKLNLRMIAGKVLMDRNAPAYLLDTPQSAYSDSEVLIKRWHKRGRLLYAITPRFAASSTPEELRLAGELKKKYPDVYVQTHLGENRAEVAWIHELYPENSDYLDVYKQYGLTGSRSLFAHAVHVTPGEIKTLAQTDSAVAFCPTSNLFLGSGLFRMHDFKKAGIRIGMGTDVGGGTSLSMLTTLNEAYKVMQLQQQKLSPLEGFYQLTLGGAQALSLQDKLGNFSQGKEADFVVLNWAATDVQKLRIARPWNLEDRLFALAIMGDDRNVAATYIMGKAAYKQR